MSINKQKQQRRRGNALEEALLDAAWEELNEQGYEQFSLEGAAKRAGTSKTVLYRRWANRLELVHTLLLTRQPLLLDFIPNKQSLRDDVIALLEHMAKGIDEHRTSIHSGMLVDALNNDGQMEYIRDVIAKEESLNYGNYR